MITQQKDKMIFLNQKVKIKTTISISITTMSIIKISITTMSITTTKTIKKNKKENDSLFIHYFLYKKIKNYKLY